MGNWGLGKLWVRENWGLGKTGVWGKLGLRGNCVCEKTGGWGNWGWEIGDWENWVWGTVGVGENWGWGTWVGILGWGTGISTCSVSEIVVTMQVACFGNLGMVQHVHRVKKPWLHFVHWLLATGYCIEFTGNFGRMVFGTL